MPQSMSGNATGWPQSRGSHRTECPMTCRSPCSGANVSPKRELASRPTIISQPHHWQSVPSPVQSANNFARRRVSEPVRIFLVTIALTTRPSFSTPIIISFRSKSCPSVKRRAFRSSSNSSADFTCPGLPPIGLISALTLPSSGYVPRFVKPPVQTRISLLPQPPRTPRSCINSVFTPLAFAANAIHTPA